MRLSSRCAPRFRPAVTGARRGAGGGVAWGGGSVTWRIESGRAAAVVTESRTAAGGGAVPGPNWRQGANRQTAKPSTAIAAPTLGQIQRRRRRLGRVRTRDNAIGLVGVFGPTCRPPPC